MKIIEGVNKLVGKVPINILHYAKSYTEVLRSIIIIISILKYKPRVT